MIKIRQLTHFFASIKSWRWGYKTPVWFAAVWLAYFMGFFSPTVLAQEDALRIQSTAFAEESARLLGAGQQRAAIIEALKGLPESFTDDVISDYPDAWLAFYRAATALIIVTPYHGDMVAVANRERTRVAFKGTMMGDELELASVAPSVLWDAVNNQEIAVVANATETNDDSRMFGYELSASPGSALFSVSGAGSPEIKLFDSQDGTEVVSLQIPPQPIPVGVSPIGISPDGTRFAVASMNRILVWDLATPEAPRTVIPQLSGQEHLVFSQAVWTSEGSFLVAYTWFGGPSQGQFGIAIVHEDGTAQSLDGEGPRIIWAASQSAPVVVELLVAEGEWLVRDLQLNILGRIPGDVEPVSFARNQTAIVATQAIGGMFGGAYTFEPVAIYGLDGTPLDLQPEDYLGFSDFVFNETGQVQAVIGPTELNATHLSEAAPSAADLYTRIMDSLTTEEEDLITAQGIGSSGATPDASQMSILQSDRIADEAELAMLNGKRHEAIILALSAFPSMPNHEDFETFERAHRALFRAYASRPAHFERPDDFLTVFMSRARYGPLGRTALYRQFELEDSTRTTVLTRAAIVDLRSNHTREIDLTEIDQRGFTDLHFTPDGLAFAGVGRSDGRVHVFDTSTGEVTRVFDASGDSTHTKTVQIGFSPDGQYFLATVGHVFDSKFALWATETGRLVYSGVPFEGSATPLGWSNEGSILVVEFVTRLDEVSGPDNLVVWQPEGGTSTLPLIREDGRPVDHCQYSAISHTLPYLACSADAETTILNFATGSIVGTIRRADSVGRFLRDGSAIGWPNLSNPVEIDVFSVKGEPLDPIMQDYVPFGQLALLGGQILTNVATDLSGYSAQEIPTALALYEAAMAELSDDDRAQLLLARPE
ncbi:WD40 repeat domain-containing protein [Vreelandella andesensis]|uniref:WD40 repeat domain-containing protein n=1 Tax=Vreelandella andesensis TaxID=447567 RepID=A0A433KHG1_9GAMM|nr:WD40 repeat domain-containing protein [Halomonas andesensis]RUR28904.1 WD40 repeat domain-containing protein [Halomonas andesensis]